MSGPDHYRAAEQLLAQAEQREVAPVITLAQHLAAHSPLDVFPLGYFCTCGERVHQRTGHAMWQARDEHIAATWTKGTDQ
ncbi:hypothetical protein ACFQNE_14115 [Gordonia phosphorivorans]|uniref:Uncharacterized protein n=1 Tax=Gordonia phosphorivorans TaxID=1056982 RepID=A0ABV6H7M1_9ACTN